MTDARTIPQALGGRWYGRCGLAFCPAHKNRRTPALSTSGMAGLVLPHDAGELVIAPDGDAPGRDAAVRLAERGTAAGWRVRVMRCPEGADCDDVAREAAA